MPKFKMEMVQNINHEANMEELRKESEETMRSSHSMYPQILNEVLSLELARLKKSPLNKFKEIDGEKWEELKGSVRNKGILTPIIVRDLHDGYYEILAGHNRVRAATEVGLTKIPAIVKDCDDLEAAYIIADTNLQREYVSDLEKGWAYRNILEANSRQGHRTDLTSSHDETKLRRTDEMIAEKYGISRATVNRKIRLTYLIEPLYLAYDRDALFKQEVAVYFSYLRKSEQAQVQYLLTSGVTFTLDHAKLLKEASAKSETPLSDKDILRILEMPEDTVKEEVKTPKPKKYKVSDDTLFPEDLQKKNREMYIQDALRYIKENHIDIRRARY